ncbi:MAG: peptide-methionine (S)-S-oxide reductase MsrA [Bacteroidetes bacterium]|nr:peptide-methionine (S)-S-oxide reductase MsrA [Bacteroidota bacterium]MCW5896811.1 peptide-methionine (S)-S-oxide reductase MsrA [Bacteroidota bacterium]
MNTFLIVLMLLGGGGQKGKESRLLEKATLGAGCFWCVEAVFQRIDGVTSVLPGYAGGQKENPTYKEVTTGKTGHAEVAQITFDPAKVSYERILDIFWQAHDPTILNRQGADVGTQYRSVIFYHDETQKAIAGKSRKGAQKDFDTPIVTELQPLTRFYEAEEYHKNYYNDNKFQPYCQFVIKPKLKKLKLPD